VGNISLVLRLEDLMLSWKELESWVEDPWPLLILFSGLKRGLPSALLSFQLLFPFSIGVVRAALSELSLQVLLQRNFLLRF